MRKQIQIRYRGTCSLSSRSMYVKKKEKERGFCFFRGIRIVTVVRKGGEEKGVFFSR